MAGLPAEERPFALRRAARFDFIEGLNRTKEALREQGFGIASTIDASGALGKRCVILGVSDPGLLRRAIAADPDAVALLPCSVAVHEDADGIVVTAIDPTATLGGVGVEALAGLAAESRARLTKALSRLPAGTRDHPTS